MKAVAYNSLPILGEGEVPQVGLVLWVCPRALTPDNNGQAPTDESYAQKYISLGSIVTEDSREIKAALCFDTFAHQNDRKIIFPGSDDDMSDFHTTGLAAISLGSPETLDPEIEEIRFGGGRWTVDSIRGAMYAWAPDPSRIDAALSEIFSAQANTA